LAAGALLPASTAPAKWQTYVNVRYGYQLCYPATLLEAQPEADAGDGRTFVGKDGAELLVFGAYNVLQSNLADEATEQASGYTGKKGKISYRAKGRGWLVLSGDDGADNLFYTKTFERGLGIGIDFLHSRAAIEKRRRLLKRRSALQLRKHALELHGVGHVALDTQLAHHECGHSVELPGGELLPVVPADHDGGVRGAVFLGDLLRCAVEHYRALVAAEVDLHALARDPCLPLLHPRHEFLLRHRFAFSFVSSD
jgi:hypothetical protein